MKNAKFIYVFLITILLLSSSTITTQLFDATQTIKIGDNPPKIKVLNFGTFHMGATSDQYKAEFDENDEKNKRAVHQIAQKIAEFKPTVIVVEMIPEQDAPLQKEYQEYLNNPDLKFENPSEIELLAYEVGRLSKAKRIYGIDHKMEYNYMIGQEIDNQIDTSTYIAFSKMIPNLLEQEAKLSLLEKFKFYNSNDFLNLVLFANADILSHVGTKGQFEGADEAAKYYQRNLRMYSNLNRISLSEEDRVFILMGASHTAFFRDFISRSTKYEMVNTLAYLE